MSSLHFYVAGRYSKSKSSTPFQNFKALTLSDKTIDRQTFRGRFQVSSFKFSKAGERDDGEERDNVGRANERALPEKLKAEKGSFVCNSYTCPPGATWSLLVGA